MPFLIVLIFLEYGVLQLLIIIIFLMVNITVMVLEEQLPHHVLVQVLVVCVVLVVVQAGFGHLRPDIANRNICHGVAHVAVRVVVLGGFGGGHVLLQEPSEWLQLRVATPL